MTDENGNAAVVWSQVAGDWGVEKVVAYLDYNLDGNYDTGELLSNASLIQWIYIDNSAADPGDLVFAVSDLQKVSAYSGALTDWNGDVLYVWLNPAGNVAGSLGHFTYVTATGVDLEHHPPHLDQWRSASSSVTPAAPTPMVLSTGLWSTWTTYLLGLTQHQGLGNRI